MKSHRLGRYRTVSVRVWRDERVRRLTPIPPCGQGLWLYLLTCPESSALPGVTCAGPMALAEALGWHPEGFRLALDEALREGLVKHDERGRVLWAPNALRHNPPQSPNAVRAWRFAFEEIPDGALKVEIGKNVVAFLSGYRKPIWLRKWDENLADQASVEATAKASGKPSAKPSGKGTSHAGTHPSVMQRGRGSMRKRGSKKGEESPPPVPHEALRADQTDRIARTLRERIGGPFAPVRSAVVDALAYGIDPQWLERWAGERPAGPAKPWTAVEEAWRAFKSSGDPAGLPKRKVPCVQCERAGGEVFVAVLGKGTGASESREPACLSHARAEVAR